MDKRVLGFLMVLALATAAGAATLVFFRSTDIDPYMRGVSKPLPVRDLRLGSRIIYAEIVSSPAEIKQGLSDRKSMAQDEGMLFELGRRDIHTFWMNRMHFNLDLIWIDGETVVEIAENLPAPKFGEYPFTYTPEADADRVLEVNAGVVKEAGLKVGDTVGGLTKS